MAMNISYALSAVDESVVRQSNIRFNTSQTAAQLRKIFITFLQSSSTRLP